MRTADLPIFEIEQRLFETLTTTGLYYKIILKNLKNLTKTVGSHRPKLEWKNSRRRPLHPDCLLCENFEPI